MIDNTDIPSFSSEWYWANATWLHFGFGKLFYCTHQYDWLSGIGIHSIKLNQVDWLSPWMLSVQALHWSVRSQGHKAISCPGLLCCVHWKQWLHARQRSGGTGCARDPKKGRGSRRQIGRVDVKSGSVQSRSNPFRAGVSKPGQRSRVEGPVAQAFVGSNPVPA